MIYIYLDISLVNIGAFFMLIDWKMMMHFHRIIISVFVRLSLVPSFYTGITLIFCSMADRHIGHCVIAV